MPGESIVLPPQLRNTELRLPYLGERETWYPPTSKLYSKILSLTSKSFFYGKGAPPNSTPDFKRAWLSFVRDQGVRIYRKQDWNVFWHRVHMTVIMYQVKNLGNEELTPYEGLLNSKIKGLLAEMPEDKPVLSRGAFFGSHLATNDIELMRNALQSLLVYTAKASEQAGQDYPGWFHETDNLVKALSNGLFVREERKKYYILTRDGAGEVKGIDVRPCMSNDCVLINDFDYSLDEAKRLAYTILESVKYVEEQAHVAKEATSQASNSTKKQTKKSTKKEK